MSALRRSALALLAPLLLVATAAAQEAAPGKDAPKWALAIHGGAGVISRDMPEEQRKEYYAGLEKALAAGKEVLAGGGTALDAVERVLLVLEDDPLFNAGKGAVYTHEGTHELDAAIMDGSDRSAGAVTGIKTVKNPIRLARLVMERSPHVFMAGEGAEAFAERFGLERVENSHFDTERRWESLQRAIEREKSEARDSPETSAATAQPTASPALRSVGLLDVLASTPPSPSCRTPWICGPLHRFATKSQENREPGDWTDEFGTVGAAALDTHGNLAAATSTGGLTNKRFGRIGDVPVIGAGTYADNASCALSGTGQGEQFIRHTVARTITALVEYEGKTCAEAAKQVIHERLNPGDGGVIGVGRTGEIVWEFNSEGMFRGAADATGRFETRIWDDR